MKKAVARVALIGLDEATAAVLTDCFHQFAIHTVRLSLEDAMQRLQKEKFEALAIRLQGHSDRLLEVARTSASNQRIVIYGIAPGSKQALQYSRWGINAVLDDPVERQATLRVVRATHLLVVHELRRYVRIPVVTDVTLTVDNKRIAGHTQEVSGGGMSVKVPTKLAIGQALDICFDLPKNPGIKLAATICWLRETDNLVGLRFAAEADGRSQVKQWIDDYLEIC